MKNKAAIVVILALLGIAGFFKYRYDDLTVLRGNAASKQASFSERLRKAANSEESIVNTVKENMSNMLGMSPKKLDPPLQKLLSDLSCQQNVIKDDFSKIMIDFEAAIPTDRNPVYEQVLLEIKQSNIRNEFDRIQDLIDKNQLFPAVESAMKCSTWLRSWADQVDEVGPEKFNKTNKIR